MPGSSAPGKFSQARQEPLALTGGQRDRAMARMPRANSGPDVQSCSHIWSGCHRTWSGTRGHDVPLANPDARPDHPFYGREIVFTGTLSSMTQALAWDRVAELGGRPAPGVTRHTNVLVIGHQDARTLRPGEKLSAKARKAHDLRERGQQIELMPEVDFTQLLAL